MEMMDVFAGPRPNFERLIDPQTPDEQQRARLLRERYKMDAEWMRTLNERYGPLDWRLPEAHSIYWASIGMHRSKKDEDVRRLRQAIYQSMNLSYQRGQMVMTSNSVRFLPNLAIAPKVATAFQEQIAAAPAFLTNGVTRAYRNFLRDVPYQFFIFNRVREGEQWLRFLREKFPDAVPPNTTLAEYAVSRATENVSEQNQGKMTGLVQALVTQSYFAVVDGQADQANEYMLRATELWTAYMNRIRNNQRIALPPIDEIKRVVRDAMLGPESDLTPEEKARLRTVVGGPAVAPVAPRKPE